MQRGTRKILAIAIALAASVWLLAWLAVAVVAPMVGGGRCAGIEFRPGTPGSQTEPAARPLIGGSGGLAGKVRSALRGEGSTVFCHDFADPSVLALGNPYYAYSTTNHAPTVP